MAMAPVAAAVREEEEGSRAEIAFFDLETSVPQRACQGYALLEFGAILVCPRRLVEVACYATLVRPADLAVIPAATTRCNGITRDAVAAAPPFLAVADAVYDLLHGRVWAGHNILRFDLPRIREAFNEIGRSPPEPKGTIDTLPLLTQRFGRRAGDMKMASLANYFGLGKQKHRSLDDARMNLEVLKYCATVLLLEASLPEVLTVENLVERSITQMDVSSSGYSGFLEPKDVSTECIKISVTPSYHTQRTSIKHKDSPLHLCCAGLKVHFGVSTKFLDNAGRPKLSIVVDIPEDLSEVLEFCDKLAQRSLQESGSTCEWIPLIKKYGYVNRPTVCLKIPTTVSGDASIYSTDMYKKEPSGNMRKLAFGKVDVAELDSLFVRGSKLDAFFSLEIYEYQQNAGIRLVAKRLVAKSKSEANSSPDSSKRQRTISQVNNSTPDGDNQESVEPAMNRDPSELLFHIEEMKLDATMQMDVSSSGYSGFLEPKDVSTECIKISVTPSYHTQRTSIKHKDSPLHLCCAGLKVQFGVSTKFLDNAGRPKLSVVVDIPEDLSEVLEFCDNLARISLQESGSTCEWRPLIKKHGYVNRPTVRLNIPTTVSGETSIYSTDMYKKEPSGNMPKLAFGKVDVAELHSLFARGSKLDAFFSLEIYEYQQNAGIRLVAKKLVAKSKSEANSSPDPYEKQDLNITVQKLRHER